MREIGGYFELENLVNNEYYKNLISLNNARNALLYILKSKNIKKIFIPFYLCDCIQDMLIKYGYDFEYYNINIDFTPKFENILQKNEYLYIVNYYGQLSDEKLKDMKIKFKQIIVDNTQSFFQRPIKDVDTIYSCRKYFGVPDGAYAYTNSKINEKICEDISSMRMKHLLGRYEINACDYYKCFKNNEKILQEEKLKYMSKLTHNILGAIDYENVRKVRNTNYNYLREKLDKYNKLNLKNPDGAFAYPLYVDNGSNIRMKLIKEKIYIPILWPNVIRDMNENTLEYKYSNNILPIPCDQRYGIQEMKLIVARIVKEIKEQF